jgi:hypothetical protein
MQAKKTRSLFQVTVCAQNIFFFFVCKSLNVQKIMQVDIFALRRAGGFKKESRENVRGMRRQGEIDGQVCSNPEGQGVSGKNRLNLFFLRGKARA